MFVHLKGNHLISSGLHVFQIHEETILCSTDKPRGQHITVQTCSFGAYPSSVYRWQNRWCGNSLAGAGASLQAIQAAGCRMGLVCGANRSISISHFCSLIVGTLINRGCCLLWGRCTSAPRVKPRNAQTWLFYCINPLCSSLCLMTNPVFGSRR